MPHRSIAHIISQQTPVTATADLTVREACQRMAAARVGALLVVEHGFLTGIFTERDALNRVLAPGLDPEHTLLSEVMTANPRAVPPEKPLSYALHLMHIGGYRVAEKWLKDRRGRLLTYDDITHYQNVVAALARTLAIQTELDDAVDAAGGWPLQ